jgi:peptide/nickel transport system permease protein
VIRLFKNWPAVILMLWFFLVVFSPWLTGDAQEVHLDKILASSDTHAWFGYDDIGRSILPRIIEGTKVSFIVVIIVTLVSGSLGITIGLVSGYYGGWLDRLLISITDIFLAFPGALLAIAFSAMLGPGLNHLMLALILTSWVSYARLTRSQTLSMRSRQHVEAAQSMGASVFRVLFLHILPLIMAPILVEATYHMAGLVIAEASLSFLGLGLSPPQASWGSMLREGVRYLLVAPHYVLYVGFSMMSLILSVNIMGDYLRGHFNVRECP